MSVNVYSLASIYKYLGSIDFCLIFKIVSSGSLIIFDNKKLCMDIFPYLVPNVRDLLASKEKLDDKDEGGEDDGDANEDIED
ncbi:hypothetical protein RJT34_18757 [Clitoria ternatea]|uniref:Uncharacterized protein n=1 Tax=Clitoria ternatea TaxID=43366 RepID=A0AAN9JBE3_CLITE